LRGVLGAVRQLARGQACVENAYTRNVPDDGNPAARAALAEVFDIVDRNWRGIGAIPKSGYRINDAYRAHDAERIYDIGDITPREPEACIAGLVLRGLKKPCDCPEFGRRCTPQTPLGATMVSAEGACAAYYQHGRRSLQVVA
jgi:hydrogenase expression/formation protein HypD